MRYLVITNSIFFGSQAILGQYPYADQYLRQSIEVDLSPKNKPETIGKIDGALKELTLSSNPRFLRPWGIFGNRFSAKRLERTDHRKSTIIWMPARLVGAVEAHDLAASKLIAFRDKDRSFVRRLLIDEMINPSELINRIQLVDTEKELKNRALNWAKRISEEL
ncbi:MAG: hypothetical protein U5J63_09490 [Fodinibius sp.]|nr:hypothetical protein [Fodinibius sp.]